MKHPPIFTSDVHLALKKYQFSNISIFESNYIHFSTIIKYNSIGVIVKTVM